MGPLRVYGALYGVLVPLWCMGPFMVYGALCGVWGPLWCMGPFKLRNRHIFKGHLPYCLLLLIWIRELSG
jgi:hypothetical protein